MAAIASLFDPELQCGGDYLVTAGSQLLVQALPATGGQGRIYTLTTTAGAVGDVVLNLNITSFAPLLPVGGTASITLYPGQKLYFGAGPTYQVAVVDAKTTLTGNTASPVPVQQLTAAIGAGTCETWAMAPLLLPTAIPLTNTDQMVEGTNLRSGLRGTQDKVSIETSSQITCDLSADDNAYWEFIHPFSQNTCKIFGFVYLNGGEIAFGPATVANRTNEQAIKEKRRAQFQLMWQPPFANLPLRQYNPVGAKRDAYDRAIRLAGF